ncbi:multicopper oxidase family protein [Sinosporangium siamense]|uniref:Oxidase (Copper-binding protein) n=1 Tax=Sinosporangium siamense TaxID=1367973 RepID=A0A919RH31_9ACTN|nr:multicopper oxidase family protein [Sinosporangium siamense]GII91841.1 putative oxidase (copper-binding protein) [Sinosporangium siamense]
MRSIDRRGFLIGGLGLAAGAALTGCAGGRPPAAAPSFIGPADPAVAAAEAARRPGAVRDHTLRAVEQTIDLGGKTVRTWSYGDTVPGAEIRVKAGETVRVRLINELPKETTVHWHGLALRNNADGVPGVTQEPVRPGQEYVYEFGAANAGTHWFHPHVGTQLDRGLYAPIIVEDPAEPLAYDEEWVVVLDDWLDGVTGTPDDVMAELSGGMGGMDHGSMESMDHGEGEAGTTPSPGGFMMMGARSPLLGGDAGDVRYPHYLVNGRLPSAPVTFTAKPGARVRIRFVNAGGDTAFRVALGGHRMTVTHTDGYPVEPAATDALLIGMGERYDVLVTFKDGVFPLVALAEGKKALARALVRTSRGGRAPGAGVRPAELERLVIGYDALTPAAAVRLAGRRPDRTITMELTGGMMRYDWGINGRKYDPRTIAEVRAGERVRVSFVNTTTMWHPMHVHGHTFALGGEGIRKDTAVVLPGRTLHADFDADNPGLWMVHCHNLYHGESGMMTLLGYRS